MFHKYLMPVICISFVIFIATKIQLHLPEMPRGISHKQDKNHVQNVVHERKDEKSTVIWLLHEFDKAYLAVSIFYSFIACAFIIVLLTIPIFLFTKDPNKTELPFHLLTELYTAIDAIYLLGLSIVCTLILYLMINSRFNEAVWMTLGSTVMWLLYFMCRSNIVRFEAVKNKFSVIKSNIVKNKLPDTHLTDVFELLASELLLICAFGINATFGFACWFFQLQDEITNALLILILVGAAYFFFKKLVLVRSFAPKYLMKFIRKHLAQT